MTTKQLLLHIVICVLLLVQAGCSPSPPLIDNIKDINRRSASNGSLRVYNLPDEDIVALGKFTTIVRLDFGGGRISDKGLTNLTQLPLDHLKYLDFNYCPNITDEGIRTLAQKDWNHLELLMLMGTKNLTNASLPHIAKIKTLQDLSLAGNTNITGESLAILATLPNLTYLDLRGCDTLSPSSLNELKQIKQLTSLNLSGCTKISASDLTPLQTALPNCRIIKDDAHWERYNSYYTTRQ